MSKVFTRNYDNLFSFAFGCVATQGGGGEVTTPSMEKDVWFRCLDGKYRSPYPHLYSEYYAQVNCAMGKIGGYLNTNTPYNSVSSTYVLDQYGMYVQLGQGMTAPSKEDYVLENPILSNISITSQSWSYVYDDETKIYTKTAKLLLTYTGADPVNVSEFGLFCYIPMSYSSSKYYLYQIMLCHETLETSVTLEQNDAIEITFSQSIMQPNYTPYPVVE